MTLVADPNNPVLRPAEPRVLGWLFEIAETYGYPGTWEDEVNPFDVGLMAIHMEYSEPWDYMWIYRKATE